MIETRNPSTGEVIERIELMDAPQIEAKLEAAARGARAVGTRGFFRPGELAASRGRSFSPGT